jgi:hypothetical protein
VWLGVLKIHPHLAAIQGIVLSVQNTVGVAYILFIYLFSNALHHQERSS